MENFNFDEKQLSEKQLSEKQKEIIKKYKDNIIYWRIKPSGFARGIFDLTPFDLRQMFNSEGIFVDNLLLKKMETNIINEYQKKLKNIGTTQEFKISALDRIKVVAEQLKEAKCDFSAIEKVLQDEIAVLSQQDLQNRAKQHRKTLLEFTDVYDNFVTTYITGEDAKKNKQELLESKNKVKTTSA